MSYTQNLWLFFVLLFGIIIVPGMDMFFVITNSLIGGKARGLAATAGSMLSSGLGSHSSKVLSLSMISARPVQNPSGRRFAKDFSPVF
jgi:threonine/homoserine/homoserine lactone efflux protein